MKYDLASNVARLQCPVLLIWGEYWLRHRVGAKWAQQRDEFASRIKNRQVVIIKDARLEPHWEYPEEVGEEVLKFLA